MRRARPLVLALLAAAGCGAEFTPRSVLVDLRVLAILAAPLEVGPAESVTLSAVPWVPPGISITGATWSFCPFSVGASVAYACAVPACEHADLPVAGDGTVTLAPGALAEECLATLAGQGGIPPGIPTALPQRIDTVVRYVVTSSDGSEREAIQLVPLYPAGAPADRNVPPVILPAGAPEMEIAGEPVPQGGTAAAVLAPGSELEVRVRLDPASAQTYVDENGRTVEEQLVVSFYTTAGRYDYDRSNGPDAAVKLKHEDVSSGTTGADLYAVARDLRGGLGVAGPFHVRVTQ